MSWVLVPTGASAVWVSISTQQTPNWQPVAV